MLNNAHFQASYSSSESESEVTQSCPTLCNPIDHSLPGSAVHGIFQARVLEWVAVSFSRGSSRPRDQTQVSSIVGRRFYCLSHQGSHSAVRVISPAYLRLFMFLPEILIPACDSSSLAFHMMYSVYKLNKQGDSIQP